MSLSLGHSGLLNFKALYSDPDMIDFHADSLNITEFQSTPLYLKIFKRRIQTTFSHRMFFSIRVTPAIDCTTMFFCLLKHNISEMDVVKWFSVVLSSPDAQMLSLLKKNEKCHHILRKHFCAIVYKKGRFSHE